MTPAAAIDHGPAAAGGTIPVFARESFDYVYAEAMPLLQRHYKEIAHYQDIPLEPDLERYRAMENIGALRIYTVRVGATGALVGYASFFVSKNPHYSSSLQAAQDVL